MAQTDGGNIHIPSYFIVPGCLLTLDVLHPSCLSDIIISNIVSAHAVGSWGVYYDFKPKLLKWVETALANSCSCRDPLSTCNLVESHPLSDACAMEDAMIGVLNRKRPRPNVAKGGHDKEALIGKQVNIVEKVSPLKTLPHHPNAGETSGTASGIGPTASPPPVRLKHRLPKD